MEGYTAFQNGHPKDTNPFIANSSQNEFWEKGWCDGEYETEHARVHVAGAMSGGVQHCVICGLVLTDMRGAVSPDGMGGDCGWGQGAEIVVLTSGPRTDMRVLGITKRVPHCTPL